MDQVLDRDVCETADRLSRTAPRLKGARLFLTGGTGFFGRWFLRALIRLNERYALGAKVVVLTRSHDAFRAAEPSLTADPTIELVTGDVRDFAFPSGSFSHVIHAATPVSSRIDPADLLETIVDGTRRVLEFAQAAGAKRFLLTSSGAVYSKRAWEEGHVPESFLLAPDSDRKDAAYGEGKLKAELLCAEAGRGLEPVIGRCFATVGPGMEMDERFAIGCFIRDAMEGGPIRILSDGTPRRSYLYITDVVTWFVTLLVEGRPLTAYNVGSEKAVSVRELADTVVSSLGNGTGVPIEINGTVVPGKRPEIYVPSTRRAREELGLTETVPLEEAIRRTAAWWRTQARRERTK